jgi:hypothetical protein
MHMHDFMENNAEAIMHDMINMGEEDGKGKYTQAKPEQDAYDIGDVIIVKQHIPWDGLNGGRTRCWGIRERGTS